MRKRRKTPRFLQFLRVAWKKWASEPLRRNSPFRRLLWAFLFVLILTALFATSAIPSRKLDLTVGDPAPYSIKAPNEFIDRPSTEKARQAAADQVPDMYVQDTSVEREVLAEVTAVFEGLRGLRHVYQETAGREEGGESAPPSDQGEEQAQEPAEDPATAAVNGVQQLVAFALDDEAALRLLQVEEEALDAAEEQAKALLSMAMQQGVKHGTLDVFRTQVREGALQSDLPEPLRGFVGELCSSLIRPNMTFDREGTEWRRDEARQAVKPTVIIQGEVIVADGKVITPGDMIRLRDAGLLREEGRLPVLAGSALMALLIVVLAGAYLYQFHRSVLQTESYLLVFGLVVTITLVVSRGAIQLSGFLAPAAAGGMLLTVLLGGEIAVAGTLLTTVSLALITGGDLQVVAMAQVGGFVGVLSAQHIGQRSDLMRAGFTVGIANLVVISSLALFLGGTALDPVVLWRDNMWGIVSGVLSAVLTIGSLPLLEWFFGILTSVKLLELANPNQSLLHRLLTEAPGTYYHSLMVANLSEAAAEAVGGDSLLARVGAYYHDVGKVRRPYFFIDNQFGGENPHDRLSPNLSALIVTTHVRDGVEMAREAHLPEEIVRFIEQHHGTTLVSYFYNKAVEEGKAEDISPENFHYDGPIPQTKEIGIVMLADACEASIRSLTRPTPDRLESTVRKVIRDRLNEGQLDRCDLTLRDLDTIARTFARVLAGVFHNRIEYPDSFVKELQKGQRQLRKEDQDDDSDGGGPAGE